MQALNACCDSKDLSHTYTIGEQEILEADIICYDLSSCATIDNLHNKNGSLACDGELSCDSSDINLIDGNLYCIGDRSCGNGIVNSSNSQKIILGDLGAENTVFYNKGGAGSIACDAFDGVHSGDGAEVVGGVNVSCSIACDNNGCDNLLLSCEDDNACGELIDTNKSLLCCHGMKSCNNKNSGFNSNERSLFRCDATMASANLYNFSFINSNDLYAAFGADIEIIGNGKRNNIYCTGMASRSKGTIKNVNNLYCTGGWSCTEAILLSSINNIWFYGEHCVNCNSAEACKNMEIYCDGACIISCDEEEGFLSTETIEAGASTVDSSLSPTIPPTIAVAAETSTSLPTSYVAPKNNRICNV